MGKTHEAAVPETESNRSTGIALMALCTAGLCWYISSAFTPSFQGKTADEWAAELENADGEIRSRAVSALKNLGPDKHTIPILIKLLREDETALRQKILIALMNSSINSEEGVRPIVAAMKDDNVGVKRGCATILASIRATYPSVVKCLQMGLSDPDKSVRRECAYALGRLGQASSAAVPDLIKMCSSVEPTSRSLAASSLGQIGSSAEPAIPVLRKMLSDKLEVEYVRIISSHALSKIGPSSAEVKEALLEALSYSLAPVRKGASKVIVRLKPIPIKELAELATSPKSRGALMAVKVMALIGVEASDGADALVKLIESENAALRVEAAKALGKIGPAGLERLVKLMRSSDPQKQQLSFRGFSAAGEGAGPELLKLLKANDPQIVALAARAIRTHKKERQLAIPLLLQIVESGNQVTGPPAAVALAANGKQVLPELLKLLEHENDKTKALAIIMSIQMGADADTIPALMKLLHSDNLNLRNQTATALLNIDLPPDKVNEVKALLASSDLVLQWCASLLFINATMDGKADLLEEPLLNILKNGDKGMKTSAAQCLSILGDECSNAAPAMANLLKDKDPELRVLGARCLSNFEKAGDFVIPMLSEACKDADPMVRQAALRSFRAFRGFKDVVLRSVLPMLEDSHEDVRHSSFRLIRRMRQLPESVLPLLLKSTGHETPDTRLQAWNVIIRHGWDSPEIASTAAKALNDSDPAVREKAVDVCLSLVKRPEPVVLEKIFQMNSDTSTAVRARVISNMARLARPPAEKRLALLNALRIKDSAVIRLALLHFVNTPALGRIPPAILTPLAEVDHFQIRIMVAEQLGRWGPEARIAIPVLKAMFDDSFIQVRRAAQKALRKIETE
jgi:HEAT repeat protein